MLGFYVGNLMGGLLKKEKNMTVAQRKQIDRFIALAQAKNLDVRLSDDLCFFELYSRYSGRCLCIRSVASFLI